MVCATSALTICGWWPDAQDTLKKQQESAARLKQEFEQPPEAGRPPAQPKEQPAEAQQARQVPFHEEELALPRQPEEAASTSPSVCPCFVHATRGLLMCGLCKLSVHSTARQAYGIGSPAPELTALRNAIWEACTQGT